MKKSLIALAVLAASGAAMAQSSVTLYGIADVWVGSVKTDVAGGASTSVTSMISGGVSTSRWGMKGSEDLGGGLKANFQLEQGFTLDDGAGNGFSRQSWVGLSGGFGQVKFGRSGSAYDDVVGSLNAVFDSDLAPTNNPGGAVFKSNTGGKIANQIYYGSPDFGGIVGALSYSLSEDANNVPAGNSSYTALSLKYSGGPLAAYFGYQKNDINNVNDDQAEMELGASYNFGMATAKLTFGKVNNTANTTGGTSEWMLGADFPLSASTTLSAGYARSTDDAAVSVNGEVKRTGFGIAAAHSLSKRTTVYGGLKRASNDNGTAADVDTNVYAVGIKHTF